MNICVVSASCPKCGKTITSKITEIKGPFRAWCKEHGQQNFIIRNTEYMTEETYQQRIDEFSLMGL